MDILWEFLENLFFRWRVTDSQDGHSIQWTAGRRRSIVRMIGTLLPFPKGQRVHLNVAVWHSDKEYQFFPDNRPHHSNPESIDEGLESASTFYLNNAQLQENTDMRKLLEEIMELKTKMNEILEQQKAHSCFGSVRHFSREDTAEPIHNCSSTCAPPFVPPPPPPPPPPPVPPMPSLSVRPPVSTSTPSRRRSSKRGSSPPSGFDDVMKELKENRMHLKPLPRTPGGRPRKCHSSDTDTPGSETGDTLADILRRRYIKSEPEYSDRP